MYFALVKDIVGGEPSADLRVAASQPLESEKAVDTG